MLGFAGPVILGGQGVINDTGQAKNFRLYGLPSNTAITMSANATMVAQIYAPQADFTLDGGGNNTYDFIDASATKSVKMNGHFNFHYDESLAFSPAPSGYSVTSWDEL